MARIVYSGLISSISGSVQGTTFQSGKGGTIIRKKPTQVKRGSISTDRIRNIQFNVTQRWTGLTETQRAEWNQYAKFNRVKQKNNARLFLSGQQVFIRTNNYRLLYGLSMLVVPTFNSCAISPISITIALNVGALEITVDRNMIATEEYIIISLTLPATQSINNPSGRYRSMIFTTTSTNVFDLSSAYIDVFGRLPIVGEFLFMKYTNANKKNGQIFPFVNEKVEIL